MSVIQIFRQIILIYFEILDHSSIPKEFVPFVINETMKNAF